MDPLAETTTHVADPPPLKISRMLHAPRETVFRAWSSPEHVKRWFAPEGILVPEARIELRVGGPFDWQDFQRVLAGQPRMRRQIHRAHSAGAQHAQDRVSRKRLAHRHRHGQILSWPFRQHDQFGPAAWR